MIWGFVQIVLNSRLARLIGTVLAAVAAVLTFGAYRKRDGVAQEKAREALRDAEAERATHDRITKADTGAGLSDDARREYLRKFAAKHGTRPPKAGR